MRSRRLHQLFIPGGDDGAIAAGQSSDADVLFYDLEDAVAPEDKSHARQLVREAVATETSRPALVRINPMDSEWGEDDLEVIAAGPTGLVLPKIVSADHVLDVEQRVLDAEISHGRERGSTELYVMIELPDAVLDARDILRASPRIEGAVFGVADFTASLSVPAIRNGGFHLVAAVEGAYTIAIIAAAAANVRIVGVPLAPLNDRELQVAAYRHLLQLGFDGLMAGSPGSVDLIEEAARPDPVDAAFARGVIETAEAGSREGQRITFHEGWFVEGPFIEIAEQFLGHHR
jgi:citrate lyase subunit beta / citryl-CoA lyase